MLKSLNESICFVGHTHLLELIEYDGNNLMRMDLSEGEVSLKKTRRYIINVGSVGQPRDDNNKAKYLIYDTTRQSLQIRYISYDIEPVAKKIIDLGMPEIHANRLW